MRLFLGHTVRGESPVVWDSETAVNGHMLLAGGSGSGKTYRLRRFITELAPQIHPGRGDPRLGRIHLLDVHGDIEPDVQTDTVKFSESTQFGLNPLAISADPDFGGVRKRINAFANMLNKAGTRLGPKQESTLRAMMGDLYQWKGFWADDPASWSLDHDPRRNSRSSKQMPTLGDLVRFAEMKHRVMRFGGSSKSAQALQDLEKEMRKLVRKGIDIKRGTRDADEISGLKSKCVDLFKEAIDGFETGRELDDVLKYDSVDTVKSVLDRLSLLEGAGIFKGRSPDFDAGVPVWRYDIKALSRGEQQMFMAGFLEELFFAAKARGIVSRPDTYIVIDEAAIACDEDPDHILNVMIREVRKFGIAIILASQTFSHYTDDLVMSSATKIVLGVDEMFHESMRRKLGLDMIDTKSGKRNPLSFIVPRETAMVQVKTAGSNGRMVEVRLV